MSDVPDRPAKAGSHESAPRNPAPRKPAPPDWVRRRRLAAVFGDVLPETTSDERDPTPPDEDAGEAWLRAQVPPHHG